MRRDRLPAWSLSAEPRLSPKVCRDARSQQSDPRAFPSPEGTNPTLRNTSRGEQRGKSGPESQGTRLASGTYTESAVEAAEVRGDARALGHVTLAFAASDCARTCSERAPAQANEARHAISGPTTWETAADLGLLAPQHPPARHATSCCTPLSLSASPSSPRHVPRRGEHEASLSSSPPPNLSPHRHPFSLARPPHAPPLGGRPSPSYSPSVLAQDG